MPLSVLSAESPQSAPASRAALGSIVFQLRMSLPAGHVAPLHHRACVSGHWAGGRLRFRPILLALYADGTAQTGTGIRSIFIRAIRPRAVMVLHLPPTLGTSSTTGIRTCLGTCLIRAVLTGAFVTFMRVGRGIGPILQTLSTGGAAQSGTVFRGLFI